MQSGIERVAEKARSDTNLRFTSLAHHITEEQLLKELKSIPKSSAVGTDKMSVEDAIKEIPIWGKEVITQVHKRSYKPDSVRRVYIPKPGTQEKRPLGVPTVKDRCLQKATSRILEAIWETDFLDTSLGGRPGKSAHQAVLALRTDICNKPVNYVLEVDLRNFFGSLDHTWMMKFVEHRVGDPRILSLIKKWLKAGVVDGNELTYPDEGTPQGGSISVILSNIYMHYVLDIWFERVVRKYLKGHATCIRFIDDFVITFQYQDDAKKVLEVLPKRMEKFGLKIHPEKTRLLRFGSYAKVKWKQEGKRKETFTFLGFCFFMTKTKAGVTTVGLKTDKSRIKRAILKVKQIVLRYRHFPLKSQQQMLNWLLRGHFAYFGVSGNYDCLKKLYYSALKWWKKGLNKRSQKGRVTWEKFNKILEFYPLCKPRIYIPFKEFNKYGLSASH